MSGMIQLLTGWGVKVDVIYPEEHVVRLRDIRAEHDLYVLKSRTEMALGYAGMLHVAGAAILNPYPVTAALRDKITTIRTLMAAGVPVPDTFVTAHPEKLTPYLEDGPLAIKPYRGLTAPGIRIVWDAEELDSVPTNQGPILAQRFLGDRGHVRKVYAISGQIFGVEQHWPARTYEERTGLTFSITPKLREIVRRCAGAFGLEVFGLDIIGDAEDPLVVNLHAYPGFRGVPDASLRLADYIYHTCRRVIQGEKILQEPEREETQ